MPNPNTIDWLHYQDAQVPDISLKDQFMAYMRGGQYIEALNLLKNNEQQLKGKAFVANAINKIVNGVLALEGEFNDNVNLYLDNLAVFYFKLIDNFENRGLWDDSLFYTRYNFVELNGKVFMALKDDFINVPTTNSDYWLELNLKGEDGANGVNLTMRYQWQSARQYEYGDIVAYGENLYVALKSNENVVPGTDETTWLTFLLVTKGKINVGTIAPIDPVQNTIWFKTDIDPITLSTEPIVGTFNRFIGKEWEEMYPATIFTWVENTENYAKIGAQRTIAILRYNWKQEIDKTYYVEIADPLVEQYDLIEASCVRSNAAIGELYDSLTMEVKGNKIILKTPIKPTVTLALTFNFQ